MVLKALTIWLIIAVGEIINGNIRVRYLQRRYGRHRAKQISFFSGVAIFATICWCFLSWIGPNNLLHCLSIGLIWAILMMFLDIYFGKFVFRFSWDKILEDFNPRKGNLLGVGILLLLFCPGIVYLVQQKV